MRITEGRILGTGLLAGALLCGLPVSPAAQTADREQLAVNEYGAAVKEFRDRAQAYLDQQKDIAKGLPPLKNTDDAAELTSREDELGKRIALARATAKPGDFIGRDLEPYVREAIKKDWANRPSDARVAVGEDAPRSDLAKINAAYPKDQPLATAPASLLAALPPLPEGLEYRLVGRHLIVRDVTANLVIEVLPNVSDQNLSLTPTCSWRPGVAVVVMRAAPAR
jgi:hypothetical protein